MPANPRIADIAAGPGTLSIMAAEQGARVSAIDFSEPMLAQFRQRAASKNLTTQIEIHHGDGQKLPFESDSYDAAFSMFGLIFFPDRIAGFRELHRILKPGRRAIVASWAPFEGVFGIMIDIVRSHVPTIPFGQGQAPLGNPDDYHREMKEAGFAHVAVETIPHDLEAPSAEEFWASVQRTNVAIIMLRQKVGEETWKIMSPSILGTLQQKLGTGPIAVRARAHLGIGTR